MNTSQELAAVYAELKARAARGSMAQFVTAVRPKLFLDPFHLLICDHLDAVLRGDILRLMIFAPPQTGKSTLVSELFPAYWVARRPDDPIVMASYGDVLAASKSYAARQIVASEEFQTVFPKVKLRGDSRAKDDWAIAGAAAGVKSAGIGGSLTGRPGGCGILDDPVKDWADAQSATIRETTWQWYTTVFRARLWEFAPLILIQTRWHEDDLAGRILSSNEAPDWTVLRLPALSETQEERDDSNRRMGLPPGLPDPLGREPGESVAPHRYSSAYYRHLSEITVSTEWFSEYQGSPRPPEGSIVKRGMLKIVEGVPSHAQRIRYWDTAGTEGGTGARTAGVLVAKADNKYYIEDVVYGRWGTEERNNIMRETAFRDAIRYVTQDPDGREVNFNELPGYNSVKIYIEREPGDSGMDAFDAFKRFLEGFPVYEDRATGSKEVRFHLIATEAAADNIRVVQGKWNADYIDEIISFPNGKTRDMADATAGGISRLVNSGLRFGIASNIATTPTGDGFD